jgi:hypothetical protein
VADLQALREGLAANLATIPDLQVSPYFVSNPSFPSAYIRVGPTVFDRTIEGTTYDLVLFVRILVAAFGDIGPRVNLDEYLSATGPRSVKQAVESDSTLGGACDDLRLAGSEGEQEYTFDDRPSALGAEFRVEIVAD